MIAALLPGALQSLFAKTLDGLHLSGLSICGLISLDLRYAYG